MRVTRANAPAIFWVTTLAAAIMMGLAILEVLIAPDLRAMLWLEIPAVVVVALGLSLVSPAFFALRSEVGGVDGFARAAARAVLVQRLSLGLLLACLVAYLFISNHRVGMTYPNAIAVCFYVSTLGQLAVIRAYG